jgi:hypothetical protein
MRSRSNITENDANVKGGEDADRWSKDGAIKDDEDEMEAMLDMI